MHLHVLVSPGMPCQSLHASPPTSTVCARGFLLGPKLVEARMAGRTEREADFYERNLRTQLTVWGTSAGGGSEVEDYANREWAGLMGGYYRPRCVRPLPEMWPCGGQDGAGRSGW